MIKKLLIFDLDGTLADTLKTISDAVNMCMDRFGYPTLDLAQVRRNVGDGVKLLMQRSLPESALQHEGELDRVLEYFRGCYLKTHDNIEDCYDGLRDIVYDIKASGYDLAVLSNKPDPLVKNIVSKLFDDGTFSVAMGQTELPKKPDPTVPLMIAKQLGYPPERVYFIGDSEVDIATAKNAGMISVCVTWGFRDREELIRIGPDFVLDTPLQLHQLFCVNE